MVPFTKKTLAISVGHQGEKGVGSLATGHKGAQVNGNQVAGKKDLLSLGALREDQHISPIGGALVYPVAAEYRVVELLKAFLHLGSIVAQWICLQCDSQQKAHVEKAIRQGIHIKYQAKQDNCDINANN